MTPDHAAAGPAAGYHFQFQRTLLDLLTAENDSAVSLETLDDIVLSGSTTMTAEQLKHSIKAGTLTDMSKPWWDTLKVWMDLPIDLAVTQLRLVTTVEAPGGSAAALLREDEHRDPRAAEALLLKAAETSTDQTTKDARIRFLGEGPDALDPIARGTLVDRIVVLDGQAGVGDFAVRLRTLLRTTLPLAGADDFLAQVVGTWERYAVELLLRRRTAVGQDELLAEIARIRNGYTERTLPDPDPADDLDEVILAAYENAPFVHQLNLVLMRSARVRQAIEAYHRAFAQRTKWLDDGILMPGDLRGWEERLVYAWRNARERMLDEVEHETDETALASAGLRLHDELQDADRNLRGSPDLWLQHGTHHGLAETGAIGWHRDFRERLGQLLGDPAAVGAFYRTVATDSPDDPRGQAP